MSTVDSSFDHRVIQAIKRCQLRKEPPLIWANEILNNCVVDSGFDLPSTELGEALIGHLCFDHNEPSLWKFLDHGLSSNLLSPLHVLALLTSRVIPCRHSQPEAYRLYLELLSRYALSFNPVQADACGDRIVRSVDFSLRISETYGVEVLELGHAYVLFFFSIVIGVIDCSLEDWGLPTNSLDKFRGSRGGVDHLNMDIDSRGDQNVKRHEHREQIRRTNSFKAIEVLCKLTENRKAMILLRLVHLNMPEMFNCLLQRMQFLETHRAASQTLQSLHQLLSVLSVNIQRVVEFEYELNKRQLVGMLLDTGSKKSLPTCNFEPSQSACWVPYDIYMENIMDGKQLPATSAIDILAETIKTLQVFNRASWQETFLALWLAALRLVQREREPLEGPLPHLETRLCVLLSIVPLAIISVMNDDGESDSCALHDITNSENMEVEYHFRKKAKIPTSKKHGLMSALQVLGQFSSLLSPPPSVVIPANIAAAKAATFVSESSTANNTVKGGGDHGDITVKAGGNMRHLIVEACIARNLLDTSAYFWSGYMSPSAISISDSTPAESSPWLTFMEGAPLKGSLVSALMLTPASSLAEIEKLYHLALRGSDEEKPAAAKILCGASLSRGWNIQEHVVHCVVKLLSPPIPPDFTGSGSHLVDYMSMLSAVLFGASSVDTVHVLSLHGVIPEVAVSLLPLCEAFGSLVPTSSRKMAEESSIYMVFSSAFLFLLRLWKFYRPPLEHVTTRGGVIGSELTLEYLLLLHNSRLSSQSPRTSDEGYSGSNQVGSTLHKPVYIESFPQLRAWYCQNKSCIASTVSGLSSGNPVHSVGNKILSMIYWKMTKSSTASINPSTSSSSSISGSPASTVEEVYQRPMLSAWEVLEAIPFVLEAILTACAHGRLSSRNLTTGLRDLVDFLPASLATIISYFSAEVTRGIWKPVLMNGVDWPSPAATLPAVESEMRDILAAAGVILPSRSIDPSSLMLPLPMAALVSLTITFKLDKSLEYIHAVAGPALENCASSCPAPSMNILGALWAQKVRRWHDFIVASCTKSVFRQNKDAVSQLLRSCFKSFLGSLEVSSFQLTSQTGVNGLLGSTICERNSLPFLAPGIIYLRSCRTLQNVQYVTDIVLELVAESARNLAAKWTGKKSMRIKCNEASLALVTAKIKEVAVLASSLICIAGGLQLVQELYCQSIPTWLLSTREEKNGPVSTVSRIVEGYAMAYVMVLSGSFVWGTGAKSPSWAFSVRARMVGGHLDFLAGVMDGNITLGCHPATWKAYVSCFVGLVVSLAPVWIQEVKLETLKKLGNGLRGWHECELALSLLERGGVAAIGSMAELLNLLD